VAALNRLSALGNIIMAEENGGSYVVVKSWRINGRKAERRVWRQLGGGGAKKAYRCGIGGENRRLRR